jgi:hypothetical protein
MTVPEEAGGTLPAHLRMYRTTPIPNSTPQRLKHTSVNLTNESYSLDQLDGILTGELANELGPNPLKDQQIIARIFSDSALGFSISSNLIQRLTNLGAFVAHGALLDPSVFYDTKSPLFFQELTRRRPGIELQMSRYLNHLGKVIAEEVDRPLRRHWTASNCDNTLKGSPHHRKPDIALCPIHFKDSDLFHWRQVDGVMETSSSVLPLKKIRNTVMSKAFCMFTEQHTRRYIINGYMVGAKFGVAYYDRSGEVRADYHYRNREDLVRLIAGFMLGSDEVLGYDPTVVRVDGKVTHVSIGKMEYRIVCALFKSQVLRGRGTVCWFAEENGGHVVIKDTWADKDRQWEEAEFLLECKKNGISGVPDVHSREDLCVGGIPDSTLRCRSPNLNRADVEDRVHRRFVMSPLCLPLTAFSSKSELVQAFIDIIQSMHFVLNNSYISDA